ncbi:hypothetical protein V2A60_004691 [Cordyceps javanica]
MAPPPLPLPLEVAVFSPADALAAQALGAARVELNRPGSYPAGGLTPPLSALAALASLSSSPPPPQPLRIPVRVMIRPRGPPPADGEPDFVYTPAELDAMRASMSELKASGFMSVERGDGFVFGVLRRDNSSSSSGKLEIDVEACKELVALAHPVPCVFHRAFDPVVAAAGGGGDVVAVVDALVACGFAGVLTAGGDAGGCLDNLGTLGRICEAAAGRIEVVAGGGVRHHNVAGATAALARYNAEQAGEKAGETAGRRGVWVHSAALKPDGSGMDEEEVRKLLEELAR